MAHLSPKKRNAAKLTARNLPTPKSLVLEVFDEVSATLNGKRVTDGVVGILMSRKSLEDRTLAQSDNALQFLGGLIARDPAQHPDWEENMYTAVPTGSVVAYTRPDSQDNLTMLESPDGTTMNTCTGTWCLQILSPDKESFQKACAAVFENAILNSGGWEVHPGTKLLVREANVRGRSWMDAITIHMAPRGIIREPCATALDTILSKYAFLQWEGKYAFTPPRPVVTRESYECKTAEEAEAKMMERDAAIVKSYNDALTFANHPSSVAANTNLGKESSVQDTAHGNPSKIESSEALVNADHSKQLSSANADVEGNASIIKESLPKIVEHLLGAVSKEWETLKDKVKRTYSDEKSENVKQKKWAVLQSQKKYVDQLDAARFDALPHLREHAALLLEVGPTETMMRNVALLYFINNSTADLDKLASTAKQQVPAVAQADVEAILYDIGAYSQESDFYTTFSKDIAPGYDKMREVVLERALRQEAHASEIEDWDAAVTCQEQIQHLMQNTADTFLNQAKSGEDIVDAFTASLEALDFEDTHTHYLELTKEWTRLKDACGQPQKKARIA